MRLVLLIVCLHGTGCDLLFNLDDIEPGRDASIGGDAIHDAPSGPVRLMFTTSRGTPGAMGGITGADAFCQTLADEAGLAGTFKAWLSTSVEGPAIRMTHHDGPYVLANGATVARNWTDRTDGTLLTPININEHGDGAVGEYSCQNGELCSSTDPNGNPTGGNCSDWTSLSASGGAARFTETDQAWTQPSCYPIACHHAMPIYCVQQ